MNNMLFTLLQYSNQDLGFDEPSYKWKYGMLLILIVIGIVYYFKTYLPNKEKEKKEDLQKLQKQRKAEIYKLSQISQGKQIPFMHMLDDKDWKCPVCEESSLVHRGTLDISGSCPRCGFNINMIPQNADGTYTIYIYDKEKRNFEKTIVKDFSFIK